ncbi:alpha/beta hydrolase [Blautia schinkii]|nr:alpha/beta hydrolase [Blautia schinkii]
MNTQYYKMNTIRKEQARMQKRACRHQLKGRKITVPTRNGSMSAFLYNEKNLYPGFLIVEVHGGGFMYNTAADDNDFCDYIHKNLGIPVISCDYSLSPHAPFPTGLEDVYDCIKYALTLPELKASPDKIILWGHSAGANLAAGAAYLSTKAADFATCLQILDYPYMDVWRESHQRPRIKYSVSGKLMDTFAHYYTEEASTLKNILISPILHSAASFRKMPPTFLLLCGRDNLNEGGKQYGKLLKKAGVPVTFYYVKEALHGFIENHFNYRYLSFLAKIPITKKQHRLAETSVNDICDWIRKETTD